ncbi:MAG: hypothetical protein FJZ16_04115 [Candidatus Omnitrophica bacterium]|nr:hypothetical protein [Candidatus Omnitrophota bacterium]
MSRIILIIVLGWVLWIGYQYTTKFQTANKLLAQKTKTLENADFDTLLAKLQKGYTREELTIEGKKYWIKWRVADTSAFTETKQGKETTSVEIEGRVDFVEPLPTSDFKLGFPFKINIERKDITEKKRKMRQDK